MPQFKSITGSYQALFTLLLPEFPTTPQSNEDNRELIQRDLHRTSYFSEKLDINHIKDRLSSEFVGHKKNNRYLQGDFEAGLGLAHYQTLPSFTTILHHVASYQLTRSHFIDNTRICYLNDANEICGLCILISADISDATTHLPGKYQYSITICRNVTDLPENRELTLFSDAQLINLSIDAEYITPTDVLNQVSRTLGSAVLFEAIRPFLLSGSVGSRKAFDELKASFKTNQNCFESVSRVIEKQKEPLERYQQAFNRIVQPEKDIALNQSFLQRHSSPILMVSACFLIGAAACATMIMFAAPAVLALAALALCIDLTMGYYAVSQIVELERYETARDASLDVASMTFDNDISPAL